MVNSTRTFKGDNIISPNLSTLHCFWLILSELKNWHKPSMYHQAYVTLGKMKEEAATVLQVLNWKLLTSSWLYSMNSFFYYLFLPSYFKNNSISLSMVITFCVFWKFSATKTINMKCKVRILKSVITDFHLHSDK